jgi:hypothetical protein
MTIMNVSETANYKTVLRIVYSWSPTMQLALIQDILKRLALELIPSRSQRNTLEHALGLLAKNYLAPSDVEVAQ